jgi:hypothetical protein
VHDELPWAQGSFRPSHTSLSPIHPTLLFPSVLLGFLSRQSLTLRLLFPQDYVLSVAVSADGQWVVSGSKDRGVQFWDAHSATVQLMLQGHKNSVISIDLSPVGGVLASGSGDWQARICERPPAFMLAHTEPTPSRAIYDNVNSLLPSMIQRTRLAIWLIVVMP